jgi:hypothetical protein
VALALTEQTLAKILIAGTGLSPKRQRRLLRTLANAVDPSPQLEHYRRRRRGEVRISFCADPDDAAEALRVLGVPVVGEDAASLSQAFGELIPRLLYFNHYGDGED